MAFLFKRKMYDQMLEWKNERHGETALLIQGARRIGKSTLVEEFAKREYESYILIDFSLDKFSNKFANRVGNKFLIYTKDLKKEEGVVYLPVYMTLFL